MHRKLEVSLFMSVEKNMTAVFLAVVRWPISQSSATRKAEQSVSSSADSALGPQTAHSAGLMLLKLTWTKLILKDWIAFLKNINMFPPNLKQIGFSYFFWLKVLPATQLCVPSGLMGGLTYKNKAWFMPKVQLKQSITTHGTSIGSVSVTQRFSDSCRSDILLGKIKRDKGRKHLNALFRKNIQLCIAKVLSVGVLVWILAF